MYSFKSFERLCTAMNMIIIRTSYVTIISFAHRKNLLLYNTNVIHENNLSALLLINWDSYEGCNENISTI